MGSKVLPLYEKLFSSDNYPIKDWGSFTTDPVRTNIIECETVDFEVIEVERPWNQIALDTARAVLKIIILPWLAYNIVKFFVGKIVMWYLLPAKDKNKLKIIKLREEIFREYIDKGFIIRYVTLQKKGNNFRGILLGKTETINNGNWGLYAVANNIPIEKCFSRHVDPFLKSNMNVLLINEPEVGGSGGFAEPEFMADSQEVAISFLESAVKAKKIALVGHSLGAAVIGQANLIHSFKEGVQYLVINLMNFSKLSEMAGKFEGKVIRWLDFEMDSTKSSKKLQELGIPEVVIQGGKDEITCNVELMKALKDEGITKHKEFLILPKAGLNDFPKEELTGILRKWEGSVYEVDKGLFDRLKNGLKKVFG